jgi:GWxTD domain-containing protein
MRVVLLTIACAVGLAAQTPTGLLDQKLYHRIAYANEHFSAAGTDGWKTDRGQMYLKYGVPDRIEQGTQGAPAEKWHYRHIDGLGNNIFADFVDAHEDGEYRLTTR